MAIPQLSKKLLTGQTQPETRGQGSLWMWTRQIQGPGQSRGDWRVDLERKQKASQFPSIYCWRLVPYMLYGTRCWGNLRCLRPPAALLRWQFSSSREMERADFYEGGRVFLGLLPNLFSRNGGAAGAPECQLSVTFHSCAYSQSKVCSNPVIQFSHL